MVTTSCSNDVKWMKSRSVKLSLMFNFWIWCDSVLLKWPLCSPEMTPLWFFFFFFSWGYVKGLVFINFSSYKPRGYQAENYWGAGECYARYTTVCLTGAELPIWRVSCHRQCAYWTLVKLCEISYIIYICFNLFLEF